MIDSRVLNLLSSDSQLQETNSFSLHSTVSKVKEMPWYSCAVILNILDDVGITPSDHICVRVCGIMVVVLFVCKYSQCSISQSGIILVIRSIIHSQSEYTVPISGKWTLPLKPTSHWVLSRNILILTTFKYLVFFSTASRSNINRIIMLLGYYYFING